MAGDLRARLRRLADQVDQRTRADEPGTIGIVPLGMSSLWDSEHLPAGVHRTGPDGRGVCYVYAGDEPDAKVIEDLRRRYPHTLMISFGPDRVDPPADTSS